MTLSQAVKPPRVLLFDVFGTLVDWRPGPTGVPMRPADAPDLDGLLEADGLTDLAAALGC